MYIFVIKDAFFVNKSISPSCSQIFKEIYCLAHSCESIDESCRSIVKFKWRNYFWEIHYMSFLPKPGEIIKNNDSSENESSDGDDDLRTG